MTLAWFPVGRPRKHAEQQEKQQQTWNLMTSLYECVDIDAVNGRK